MNTNWTDLYRDGRRLERIIKQLETKLKNTSEDSLRLAYIDRLIKTTQTKVHIAVMVLSVEKIIREAEKKHGQLDLWEPNSKKSNS